MFEIWLLILFRVLTLAPYACHYLKPDHQDVPAVPLSHNEQRISARLQQNPDLARLKFRLTWTDQQAFAAELVAATRLLTATAPPTHDPPAALAGSPPLPVSIQTAQATNPAKAWLFPHVWTGSHAYSAQAPPALA
ncbi:MAG: hypothetical protein P4L87_12630 [Formivibrio sp.]|nr:hypothetical protein [Formivibrio sp.]